MLGQQLDLFATDASTEAPPATPARRTWADVRRGEQTVYDVPGSPWRGTWTVRRIERHPRAPYALIVDLVNVDGRVWQACPHRDAPADVRADR
ncbi:hypothetical protein CSH63_24905 [Micromonospora tulbaghiae]|uniref:Uncharacterized protein n=1 Tax=Micromonospora tulbaghiae TaxID=479978 RepID=A0A386WW48_9ACTN|nr:hypothetical protein [Micromonospora tulbaghiae]AYF30624.1 hypothetical protein CSH63_24905 [Micromonospora tulbaghiae]